MAVVGPRPSGQLPCQLLGVAKIHLTLSPRNSATFRRCRSARTRLQTGATSNSLRRPQASAKADRKSGAPPRGQWTGIRSPRNPYWPIKPLKSFLTARTWFSSTGSEDRKTTIELAVNIALRLASSVDKPSKGHDVGPVAKYKIPTSPLTGDPRRNRAKLSAICSITFVRTRLMADRSALAEVLFSSRSEGPVFGWRTLTAHLRSPRTA